MKFLFNSLSHFKTLSFLWIAVVLTFSSCAKKTDFTNDNTAQAVPPLDDGKISDSCVQVFYDQTSDSNYQLGRTYALMLLNLLGHFPDYQQIVGPIELYKKGDLDKCKTSFYIGSYYENTLPADFITDYKSTTRNVVWMGYNYWKLGQDFETIFGYHSSEFTTLDYASPDANGKPGFFRDILYKGETFYKYNEWKDSSSTELVTAFEMTKLSQKTSDNATVMATAQHTVNGEIIPWALKSNNYFYVTEIPFSYIHEADRYLVFSDLLFDFLNAPARHNSKYALLRLEDIHPYTEMNWLNKALNILQNNAVLPHINIIPIFRDPNFYIERNNNKVEVRMEERTNFFNKMQSLASTKSAVFIWHGITHQYKDLENPFSATSGDDYEFWNAIENKPLAEDSVSYVLDKFDDGFESLKLAGIAPQLWVTPHYHASALDDIIFGQIFSWVIGRGVYSDFKIGGVKALESSKPLGFDLTDTSRSQNRRDFLSDLNVESVPHFRQFGQIYPYELYGNIYGQRVIPENLGNVQPYLSNQVTHTRTVEMMLEDARRNLVLRDVWASAFYHPFLLDKNSNPDNDTTGPTDLARLVKGLKNLGYTFINMEDYAKTNSQKAGKPRIELEEIR